MGEGQRERETQNLKQAPGSELLAQSLMQGSNSGLQDQESHALWTEPVGSLTTDFLYLFIFLNFFHVYLFFETEHKQEKGRERGKHRLQSRLQALSCWHRARRGA